jgi:hypothetical protein
MPKKQHKHEHVAAKGRGSSTSAGAPKLRGEDKKALVTAARSNASTRAPKAPTISHRLHAGAKTKGTPA